MLEVLLISLLLAAAAIPLLSRLLASPRLAVVLGAVLFALIASAAVAWRGSPTPVVATAGRPIEVVSDNYVSSQGCRSCHPQAYSAWHASYHRTMTQVATPGSVAGDFDGIELHDEAGRRYRLSREADKLFVEFDDPETAGERVQREIVMTTGSHHYQAYWFSAGQGRELGMLPFIYLIDEEQYGQPRWILRRAAFLRPPASPDAEAKPLKIGRWNQVCYMCHTTRGQPRWHGREHADTHAVEFGIACESCHGPGYQHINANHNPVRRYDLHQNEEPDATIVNPSRLPHQRSAEVCGQCHSVIVPRHADQWGRWQEDGFAYRPGDDLSKTRLIDPKLFVLNEENVERLKGLFHRPDSVLAHTYWPDGMIKVSGREFSGLIATPCYQQGTMSCLSCHEMHQEPGDLRTKAEWANDQLKPGMRTNEACYQCHESYRDNLTAHTHHTADSAGSRCYNCHMPHTSYGLLKAIRSHQIDSPSVLSSLEPIGRPNACNQCHLDKTLAWTAEKLDDWYDIEPPQLTEDEQQIAASVLWLLKGDAAQRALAAWTMSWQPAKEVSGWTWMPPFLAQILLDPYDSNRFIAQRTIRGLPGMSQFPYDFMASEEKRREQGGVFFREWLRANTVSTGRPDKALLVDEDGKFDFDTMQRLLRERDNRPVYLNE